jgi:hypothetical protein
MNKDLFIWLLLIGSMINAMASIFVGCIQKETPKYYGTTHIITGGLNLVLCVVVLLF